jgi:hypothetical protein
MENSWQVQVELTQTHAVSPYRQGSKVVMLQAPSDVGSAPGHASGLVVDPPPEPESAVLQLQLVWLQMHSVSS